MKKSLQTAALLISILFWAGGMVRAEEDGLPADISENIISSDSNAAPDCQTVGSVSGNDSDMAASPIISVSAPNCLDFIMDPYELAGQGSIWSQEYSFVNTGDVPVKIFLEKLHCTAADDVIITENEEAVTKDGKTAALWLDLNDGSILRITEKNSACEISLSPGEALIFRIRGKISICDQWENGDLGLSVLYRLEAAE